jgi:hypothetical protein
MKDDPQYPEAETERRMENAWRRALTTPYKPNQAFIGKNTKPDSPYGRKTMKLKASK